MPRTKKSEDSRPLSKGIKEIMDDFNEQSDVEGEGSPSRQDQEAPLKAITSAGNKRKSDADYDPGDFSHEMQKMLEGFGADINKTLCHKKKRMEQLTQSSLKNTNKKVEEIWKNQQLARGKLQEEFSKQVNAVYQQWESDIEKTKDQEEKLNTLFRQQQKLFQQSRIVQTQRLKTVRELSEQFVKGLEELERTRQDQQTSLQSEMKKEMQLLQKRILMDAQQQEMASVRKSLHSMLF